MTDEQIKALECCNGYDCETCRALKYCDYMHPGALARASLDIINRQKAENGELRERITYLEKSIDYSRKEYNQLLQKLQQAKSEAIKEFAERLKSKVNDLEFRTKTHRKTVPVKFCDDNANWVMHECVPKEIDNLVKEMTEVQK